MGITVKSMGNGVVRITAEQAMDHDQASEIFYAGLSELNKPGCKNLEIDLRTTQLLENVSLYKMYKLIYILKDGLKDKADKVTTIFYQGEKKRQDFLEKTVNKEGIRLFFAEQPAPKNTGTTILSRYSVFNSGYIPAVSHCSSFLPILPSRITRMLLLGFICCSFVQYHLVLMQIHI